MGTMGTGCRTTAAAAAMLLLPGLAGCSARDDGAPAGGPAERRTLEVVGPFELHSLDPATAGGFFTRLQVAETLVEADDDGALRPGLAAHWEVADNQRTWRFTLREDAVFHDGTPVSADHVVAALEAARAGEGTPLTTVPLDAVTADGDGIRLELSEPFAPLPAVLAHTSTQILAPSSYGPDGTVTSVIGSGPYRVERVQQPSSIEVVAFDQWHEGEPAVRRVSYSAVGRPESRALAAQGGDADVVFGMDPVSLQRLQGRDGVEIVSATLPRAIQLKVDGGHALLGDVRVRRALSMALDREGMAAALLRDPEMAADQLFPPSLPEWHADDVAPLEHDRQAAKALLAEAGFTPGPDGVLVRDGRRFAVSLRTFPDRPELPTLATAMQASLAEVGVAVDVQIGNSSEIPAGHTDGSLEMGLYARNFALVPDPLVTLLADFGPEGAEWGAMRWNDPGMTAALQDLADGASPEQARAGRRQVAEVLQRELPVIPVAWYRQSAVVNERVRGLSLDPLERTWRLTELSWA
jgi:peptide/nickel transport system substrate-binding protein